MFHSMFHSTSGDSDVGRPTAALTLEQLTCMADGRSTRQQSVFASRGQDRERIERLLAGAKACSCQRQCCKQFSTESVVTIRGTFWKLTKACQDALLWSLACARSKGAQVVQRRAWSLDTKRVCREAFCSLLGIGAKRLRRISRTLRGKDLRSAGSSILWQSVEQ